MSILFIMIGCVLLFLGAEGLVRGSARLAASLGLTPLVIGMTVVAFGTSSPELAVSLKAAAAGNSDIALGNVIGSNISNIALILGLTALIAPLKIQVQITRMEIPIMIGASVYLAAALVFGGGMNRAVGFSMVMFLAVYSTFSVIKARAVVRSDRACGIERVTITGCSGIWVNLFLIVIGLAGLVAGSDLLVRGATKMASGLGVSDAVIGLTVVALGTSLPELATSVAAAVKGETDLSVGNIIGSNIFNILAILGLSSLVRPLGRSGIDWTDLGVMLGLAILTLPLMRSGFRLTRPEGGFLVAVYIGFITFLLSR